MASATFFDRGGRVGGASVLPVRIDALQLEHNQFGAIVVDAFFGPGGRVGNHILERTHGGFRPVFRLHVPDFHGNSGFVGHVTFKLVKRIAVFSADGHRLRAFPQGDLLDFSRVRFLVKFEAQCYLLHLNKFSHSMRLYSTRTCAHQPGKMRIARIIDVLPPLSSFGFSGLFTILQRRRITAGLVIFII
jgi:hypothetical protein